MEDGKVCENHLTSAAAFVEGGIQEACDDACSICLEAFCDSDPSTLTTCKHEFHLQCILEWCQRSSQCPMCWQSISLKDSCSQELLDAVEQERNIRMNPPRNTTIFHHPALGDFELQHLPVNASESELQERIIQHLAAAAAMDRARRIARREGQRNRSSQGQGHGRPPHFLVLSNEQRDGTSSSPQVPNSPFITTVGGGDSQQHMTAATSSSNRSPSPTSQDTAGPSDFQSFSDSLKSRLTSLSTRYKDSITKSTRGWKERLFARNSTTPEVHGEGTASGPGIPTISRMMDHLQVEQVSRTNASNIVDDTAERQAITSNEDAPSSAASATN